MEIKWIRLDDPDSLDPHNRPQRYQARFANGYGLSVILEQYASRPGLLEAAVLRWDGDNASGIYGGPVCEQVGLRGTLRYATFDDVMELAKKVAAL